MKPIFSQRLRALLKKEFNQIRRDRRVALSLILPPVLQLLLFGFVLNSKVENLRLGVIDDSRTPESREFIATLSESKSFELTSYYLSPAQLTDAITQGKVQAGLIVPYDYARNLQRGRQADVQFLLNAMDANTATIARTYAQGVIASYTRTLPSLGVHANFAQIAAPDVGSKGRVDLQPSFLYNPGLVTSWFTVTGVLGLLCILNGSIVASATMVKEREAGTIEQLLMSPAGTSEIIFAKIAPIFLLLCVMTLGALGIMRVVFHVPFHGSFVLVFSGAALCLLSGIGIGTFIATFTKSAEQAQLTSFFINPPLASLSGALTPMEAMPHWMQPLTKFNPIYHFGVIARASMLKGSGIDTLWPNFLALLAFTVGLVSLSIWRFRKQLG
jgi:ABC-2 type transport system permease protein